MNQILLLGMPGGGEIFIIVLVIIMLFGSKKIPELARGIGKGMREIKNATNSIQNEIKEGAREMNIPKNPLDIKKQVKDMINKEVISDIEPETTSQSSTKPPVEPNSSKSENPNS